jgi:hypothetical protein
MLLITFVELRVVAGRSRKRADRPHAVSGQPKLIHTCHAHAAMCGGFEKSLSGRRGHGMARVRQGMACMNQTRPHCVIKWETQSKPLAARHGRGTAWVRHGKGMVCVDSPLLFPQTSHRNTKNTCIFSKEPQETQQYYETQGQTDVQREKLKVCDNTLSTINCG